MDSRREGSINLSPAIMQPPQTASASNLTSRGSITRGIIIGTNRDAGLESALRFELQGNITEQVYLTAVLSDQNTIIQPEGTTQNLREFDQVFIRMDSPWAGVQLGDIDVSLENSAIVRMQRRLQGAEVNTSSIGNGEVRGVASIMRGSFRAMEFRGTTGIQGPYRLTGNQNEPYIMVVAGTEKVFLNGQLLRRGEDLDYIIDYSIGEITFTGRNMIRSSHRIRVEFQYLSFGYNRTIVGSQADQMLLDNRIQLGVTYIREADAIDFGSGSLLREDEINAIRNAGDNLSLMRVSGADSVGYRPESPFILYARIDTLIAGQTIQFFRHQPGDPIAVYRVTFTYVGSGAGSYKRAGSIVNGIIYEWVGAGNGDYEPFRQLTGPTETNILAVRAKTSPFRNVRIYSEWGGSSTDPNRLSPLTRQSRDYMSNSGITIDSLDVYFGMVEIAAIYEYKGKDFRFFDRVRDAEFDRSWGLITGLQSGSQFTQRSLTTSPAQQLFESDEHLSSVRGRFRFLEGSSVEYSWQQLLRDDRTGRRQGFVLGIDEIGVPSIRFNWGGLDSKSDHYNLRHELIDMSGSIGYAFVHRDLIWTTGFRMDMDRSVEEALIPVPDDDRIFPSYDHREWSPWIQVHSERLGQLQLSLAVRDEKESLQGTLSPAYSILTPSFQYVHQLGKDWSFQTQTRMAYQWSRPHNQFSEVTGATEVKGASFRSSNEFVAARNFIRTGLLYDVSTESRPLMQETYLEVGPEFGQYVWIDINNDGIRQIEEFFPEQNPNEGTYIRQFIPGDEVLPVVSLRTRFTSRIDPRALSIVRDGGSPFMWLLGQLHYITTLDIREQSNTEDRLNIYLVRPGALMNDETTISGQVSWNQEIQLARRSRDWDIRVRRDQRSHTDRRFTGLEKGNILLRALQIEYNFDEAWTLSSSLRLLDKKLESEMAFGRNYDISGWEIEPGLRLLTSSGSLFNLTTLYGSRDETSGAGIGLFKMSLDGSLLFKPGMQFLFRGEFRSMNLSGELPMSTIFELTDGAGGGRSTLWNAGFRIRNSDWVQSEIQYNGRTIRGRSPLQNIRITVTATF